MTVREREREIGREIEPVTGMSAIMIAIDVTVRTSVNDCIAAGLIPEVAETS